MSSNAKSLTFEDLEGAVTGTAAAFRCVLGLAPAGGADDKIFPPTYAGAEYAKEKRRIRDGEGKEREVNCVLLDSVQSQANRMEEALLEAVLAERFQLPVIEVDFTEANKTLRKPVNNVTSLQAPHRLADAILRDSVCPDGTSFRDSDHAKRWRAANARNATPIYELCPTALVFGLWGSPEKPGGLGAKFERTIVSEIVAVDCLVVEKRSGFRIDPLEIRSAVRVIPGEGGGFTVRDDPNAKGSVAPSEINHGNIVFDSANAGVRCRFAEQTTVLSLAALRRLCFPMKDGKSDPKADGAARIVLAAIALCGATLASERGLNLRSRCLLVPTETRIWEILDGPGKDPRKVSVDAETAVSVVKQAVQAAKKVGLTWREERLVLKPSPELVRLVKESQERATKESGEGAAA
jgi:CRISPR-associated protein Csb1